MNNTNSESTVKIPFTNVNQKAFLDVSGVPIVSHNVSGLVIYEAPDTPEVRQLINKFNDNGLVRVLDFVAALQAAKQEIYNLRGQGRRP